jgi:hypothetical protein
VAYSTFRSVKPRVAGFSFSAVTWSAVSFSRSALSMPMVMRTRALAVHSGVKIEPGEELRFD